ncbi:MAG: hypoxanthine phosphoribosyltransferase [FCB group bacterium]|jgi:hypoxanthine phosphoribosyltransferase
MALPENFRIKDKNFKVYISCDKIKKTVEELAARISADYTGKKPLFLVVLKGSIFFASDLLRAIDLNCEIEMIRAKSYGKEMSSSGKVNLILSELEIEGKDVIVIEDIIDTGFTLQKLFEKLQMSNPASIEAVALVSKPSLRKVNVKVKYIGIEIPDVFVIGYGMDFAEQGRNLPAIYAMEV